jgi:WD40 repeat protein
VLLGLKDGRAIHIDQRTGRRLEVVAHRHEAVTNVDLVPDGAIAASGGKDGRVMVWDTRTGEEIHVMEHASRIAIARFDPPGRRLLTADEQGDAFIWDLGSGAKLSTVQLGQRQHVITAAQFSNDGTRLLLGFPGRDVRLWNSSSGQLTQSWRTPNRSNGLVPQGSTVYAVAFNEQENSIIAESSNGLGRAWSIAAAN